MPKVVKSKRSMQLTDWELYLFWKAYKKGFDEELTWAEAREMATNLLELYAVLARPLPSERQTKPDAESPRDT